MREFSLIDMTDMRPTDAGVCEEGCSQIKQEFLRNRKNDKSLESYWARAQNGSSEFCVINNLLYRRARTDGGVNPYRLVVPSSHAMEIIKLAHSNALSGHCSTRKTIQRIKAEYFIKKLRKQVLSLIHI